MNELNVTLTYAISKANIKCANTFSDFKTSRGSVKGNSATSEDNIPTGNFIQDYTLIAHAISLQLILYK